MVDFMGFICQFYMKYWAILVFIFVPSPKYECFLKWPVPGATNKDFVCLFQFLAFSEYIPIGNSFLRPRTRRVLEKALRWACKAIYSALPGIWHAVDFLGQEVSHFLVIILLFFLGFGCGLGDGYLRLVASTNIGL